MFASLRGRLAERAARWARQRQGPDTPPLQLHSRRLYILPTRTGLGFAALLFVMLVAGLNYANSLALLVTFTMGSCLLVGMHECQRSLQGLALLQTRVTNCFAGTTGTVELYFSNPARLPRRALTVRTENARSSSFELAAGDQLMVRVEFLAGRRGRQAVGRLELASTAPFGLFRCWTWLHLPLEALVYPQPSGDRPLPPPADGRASSRMAGGSPGADEWSGLRAYQTGDSPRSIAWKTWARGAPLMVAQYHGAGGSDQVLSLAGLEGMDLESQLSQICAWIQACARRGVACALRLPGLELPMARGAEHTAAMLAALALYRIDPAEPAADAGADARRLAASRPARSTSALGLAALLITATLNAHHLAWWCLPVMALASALHLHAALRAKAAPGRWARAGLAAALTLGVLLSFHTLNGLAAGATLLAAMAAAKLFEARSARDWCVITGATLFLLLAACLDRQQTWRLPCYALSLWLVLAALRGLAGGAPLPARTLLRESARQLLFALPLALVLFLFFPRLPGAFWALPSEETAVTGLGEEMSPGGFARLVASYDPALRARFDGAPPPPAERYWRGPVLHDFDGYTWRRRAGSAATAGSGAPAAAVEYRGPPYRYSLSLEPGSHRTIVALELTRPPELPSIYQSADLELISRRPLSQPQGYQLTAYPAAVNREPLSAAARSADLQLPGDRNPRSRALALQLRAGAADDADFAAKVLAHFHDGGFEYTLTPPPLGQNAVDELLFGTHRGFCGHYASAFVDLMRAGGVPARVVTGYQGGEWNPIGHFLEVRQADAHAWAEIWLAGRGWVRADPTAMVAPERLNHTLLDLGAGFGSATARVLHDTPWLNAALQTWEAVDSWWLDEVVGFNFTKQLRVAEWLGFGDRAWRTLAIALGIGMGLWLSWLAWSLRRLARAAPRDPLGRAWTRLERRLARAGLVRAAHEGVLTFAERLARTRPDTAPTLLPLARRYVQLRFGPPVEAGELSAFLRAARAYRAPRAHRAPGAAYHGGTPIE